MQSLIERFTELTAPAESPLSSMGELEDGSSPEDAELGRSRAQRSMVLQQASQRITQANMSLHKLRTHFHKVRALPILLPSVLSLLVPSLQGCSSSVPQRLHNPQLRPLCIHELGACYKQLVCDSMSW